MKHLSLPNILLVAAGAALAGEPARPLDGLSADQQREFEKGEQLFRAEWAVAPAESGVRDGLGPLFHAVSCAACHPGGGRGLSPDATDPGGGLVFRIGTRDAAMIDDYGSQLSPLAVAGVEPEGAVAVTWTEERGSFPDGTPWALRTPTYQPVDWRYGEIPEGLRLSPRLAPAISGLGLLEAVPQEALSALADPDDEDGDGISGRMNLEETWEGYNPTEDVAGRFGWKAWMPTLLRQVCGALGEDMGLTNVFQPHDTTVGQSDAIGEYARGGHGSLFEANGRDTRALVAFLRWLAPPARRDTKDLAAVKLGMAVFASARCSDCHVPELKTGILSGAKPLSGRVIHPYSDLLLHDMGPALADGRPEAEADGNEWRTAPLWGLGLAIDDEGAGLLLHDGRARSLEEAILWHGGEGAQSRDAFKALPPAERAALLQFLRSL